MITQRELLAIHSKQYRPDFNPELFKRSTEEIVHEVQNVIQSICCRDSYFKIEVLGFEVVDDYLQIMEILHEHEESHKNRNKDKSRDNKYDYIDIKPSSFILLMVRYRITSKDEQMDLDVPIAIPLVEEKYYFRLAGNLYLPQLQIVDASTYNNALANNSRNINVVLKTLSQPIKIYKRTCKLISTNNEVVEATYFDIHAFTKITRAFKYIFAEYGFYGGLQFLGMEGICIHDMEPENDPRFYVFHNKINALHKSRVPKVDVYIQVSKYLFDNDVVTQNVIATIIDATASLDTFDQLGLNDFWKLALGRDFNSATVEKGEGVLTSFRGLLDISTKENMHLPPDMKRDIFDMVKWMVSEFSALRAKDNLNILTKRIRVAEYIASIYAAKLNTGVYRITDIGKKVTVEGIRKVLDTDPMVLLKGIPKSSLVSFKNVVTDVDSAEVLKFSVKGQSGLGENSSKSIPMIYRHAHESYPGIVDLNTASATDPGVTGIICPTAKVYDGGFFSQFEEPNNWPQIYAEMLDEHHRIIGIREANVMKQKLGFKHSVEDAACVEQLADMSSKLMDHMRIMEQNSTDGRICPFITIDDTDGAVDYQLVFDGGCT